MKCLSVGDKVPALSFKSTDPKVNAFKDLLGHRIVLYFYPKDNTPGCTVEGKDFRDLHEQFEALNTCIIGVSRDSLVCHQKFATKLGLPFALITDHDESICRAFNVLIEKNMFMRLLLGIERSTFIIDEKGVVRHIWRKVKVKGHAKEVLETIKQI